MKALFSVLCLSLILSGCATASLSVKRGYDFTQTQNVGVLDFTTPFKKKGEPFGQLAADLFSMELLSIGFSVIERSEVERIMKELNLSQSGAVDPSLAKEVGKLAGVDAVVFGSLSPTVGSRVSAGETAEVITHEEFVNSVSPRRRRRNARLRRLHQNRPRVKPKLNVSDINLTAKMVHVETGEILWVASANKDAGEAQASIEKAIRLIGKKLGKTLKI